MAFSFSPLTLSTFVPIHSKMFLGIATDKVVTFLYEPTCKCYAKGQQSGKGISSSTIAYGCDCRASAWSALCCFSSSSFYVADVFGIFVAILEKKPATCCGDRTSFPLNRRAPISSLTLRISCDTQPVVDLPFYLVPPRWETVLSGTFFVLL